MVARMVRHCARCGRTGECPEGGVPPEWAIDTGERGRVSYLCPPCTREHVRSIEAKLPEEWWE